MDIKALQLICRFAQTPNQKGYCGRESARERFEKCVKSGICEGVEEEIENFIVLNPYLETIAKLINKDKFSYAVAEAYIFGNDELKKIKNSGYVLLLENFSKQGVPDWLVADLKKHPPQKFIPTHLFQVLHVGVGRASGSVPFNQETINNCMVSVKNGAACHWGKRFKFLTASEVARLEYWNNEVLKAVKPRLPSNLLGEKKT
jgi:hypothetical protein